MSAVPGQTLAGRRIVVTRPAEQAGNLADLVAARGGTPLVFPVLEIRDVTDRTAIDPIIDRLHTYDYAVFVSPSAVDKAMGLVTARRTWPPQVAVATVGKGSEAALARHGFAQVIAPSRRFDSEGLLELLTAARVSGKRVVIFRGDGGRELLGDTLAERGAHVDYATCYRRGRPEIDPGPLLAAAARGEIDAVTVTSSEGLENLAEMVGEAGREWLRRTPVFVPHPRIAERARSLGLARVVQTAPADAGLVAGLESFFAKVSS
jgi:uroporphyrinogen-III synthase